MARRKSKTRKRKSTKTATRKRGDITRKVKITAYWRGRRGPNKGQKRVKRRTVGARKRYRVARHNRRRPRR